MRCLAVAHRFPAERLRADVVRSTIAEVTVQDLVATVEIALGFGQ